jgi:hypothetical protein
MCTMGTVSREGMVLPDKVSFHVMAIGRTWYHVNQENREHRLESHSITWFGISSPKLTYQHVASVEQNQTKSPKQTIATPHTKRTEPPIDQRRATPRTRTAWPGSRRTRGEGAATGARYRNTAGSEAWRPGVPGEYGAYTTGGGSSDFESLAGGVIAL